MTAGIASGAGAADVEDADDGLPGMGEVSMSGATGCSAIRGACTADAGLGGSVRACMAGASAVSAVGRAAGAAVARNGSEAAGCVGASAPDCGVDGAGLVEERTGAATGAGSRCAEPDCCGAAFFARVDKTGLRGMAAARFVLGVATVLLAGSPPGATTAARLRGPPMAR